MPAVSAVSIFAMSGRSSSRQESDSGAAGQVVESDQRAALAVRGDHVLEQVAVGAALGLDDLEADPRRVGAEAADDRPRRAQRALDVQRRARVEVHEQDLAVGQQRQPDFQRSGAGAVVEREDRVVRLGGGHQLAAAQLDGAELAAHQRLAAEARPPASSTIGWKCGCMRPCERNSGNQSVRVRSSSVSAGTGSDCSSASRIANRQARSEIESDLTTAFSRSSHPGPAREALHADIALGGLGGEVLDLVEHGRTVREQSHAIHGGGGRGGRESSRPKVPALSAQPPRALQDPDSRSSHFVGRRRPAARTPARPRPRPIDVELVGEVREHEPPRTRRGAALARLLRREVPAHAVALRPRERGLDQQQIGVARELAQLLVGPAVGGEREPRAVLGELDGVGRDEVRDGWNRTVNPPIATIDAGS